MSRGTQTGHGLDANTLPAGLVVTGGRALNGSVRVDGSTTAARMLIAAAAALRHPVVLDAVPHCEEVSADLAILTRFGWTCTWDLESGTQRLTVAPGRCAQKRPELLGTRAGIHLAPALLSVYDYVVLPWPDSAREREQFHESLQVHKAFGDGVTEHERGYALTRGTAPASLATALPARSQTATFTALIHAASTRTDLTLEHPDGSAETRLLWASLCEAGFTGSNTEHHLRIAPSRTWPDRTLWRIPGDRFEAGLYACAIAATGGRGSVTGVGPTALGGLREQFERVGAVAALDAPGLHISPTRTSASSAWDGIRGHAGHEPRDLDPLYTPLLAALALNTAGHHRLEDCTDPALIARLRAVFARLGAEIPHTIPGNLIFIGPLGLRAGEIVADDAETAAAALIAALAASGTSVLGGIEPLLRRYPRVPEVLGGLGAKIEARPLLDSKPTRLAAGTEGGAR